MKRLLAWSQSLGMAWKLFFALFIVTVALFIGMAYKNFKDSEEVYKQLVTNDSKQMMIRTNQFIDAYVENIKNILSILAVERDWSDDHQESIFRTLQRYGDMSKANIKNLYVMKEDGSVYASSQLYFDILGNSNLTELYRVAAEQPNSLSWSEPYESLLSGKTIAFMQPVKDPIGHVSAVVIAEIDLENLTLRLKPLLAGVHQTFTVLTGANNVVTIDNQSSLLPYDKGVVPVKIHPNFIQNLSELDYGYNQIDGPSEKLVVIKSLANYLGWSLYSIFEESYFYESVSSLYTNTQNTLFLWVIALLILTFFLSRYFTNPIKKLAAKMDKVHTIEVPLKILDVRNDEVGSLINSYNLMMDRIVSLIQATKVNAERRKEIEIKMLQSQIGPHFLHNTLACIHSLAQQHRTDEVADTIRSLTGLLSYSFDKVSEKVTLKQELESIRMFMQIQSTRYGPYFEMHIEASEETLQREILKLSIQPLVENAIFHGIMPTRRLGIIRIRALVRNQALFVYVADNGAGMSRETRDKLFAPRDHSSASGGLNSIGFYNVHERFRLHYGELFGLKVASKEGCGTVIRLKIPVSN